MKNPIVYLLAKSLITIILFLITVTVYGQREKSVILNPSGLYFNRPAYLEFERMVARKIAISFRANYIDSSFGNTIIGREAFSGELKEFTYDFQSKGVGIGFYTKFYFSTNSVLDGLYLGIGIDALYGEFGNKQSSRDVFPTNGNDFEYQVNEESYMALSIPLGYKFQLGNF